MRAATGDRRKRSRADKARGPRNATAIPKACSDRPPVTHFGHTAQTAGGYNVVVRAGNLRLRRLLVKLVNRHGVAHAADCGMADEDWLGAIHAGVYRQRY